ncbi:FAD-dependent oxidoreductase [Clostridium coskatii]|uniref:NADH oxidase n=1 Tax=Clostridium coskatii TaxID=1705578 RepID=A0A168R6L6_9CLOT|nr:FAD-dependent oxidoreductase [Clostridium coskatii]OAA90118.1 NADH oxidase [Clostridium coskatii]OBR92760.1 NADH oxidase [Clostridium coskatii]
MSYENLLSPINIGSLKIRNRVVMGAMGSATANENATISECECAYYAERAKGGVGLIINEVTRVNNDTGIMMPRQSSAATDECIPGLRKLANAVHYYDGAIFIQLHHPGRQTVCEVIGGKPTISPSGIKSMLTQAPCREMTNAEVKSLVQDFINAAERCYKAGIDGVELHAAHGYMLNQFLSPFTNKRTDEYGGSTENRARIIKEIIQGIRQRVGREYPVIMRISADEFLRDSVFPIKEDGLLLDEAVEICKYLVPFGLDAINVSAGIYETMNKAWEPTSYPEGWKIYLAEAVKKAVDVPVFGVGTIRNPDFAEKIISEGKVDCVTIARGLLADPDWVKKTAEGRVDEIRRCISCLNCMDSMAVNGMKGEPFSCAINARAAREWFYNSSRQDGNGRMVVVVGGGPSGMEAARVLAERKFKVILFEKNSELGGQLCLANKPPHKEKINWLIKYFEVQLKKLGVEIHLNTPATIESIKELNPYAVFIGTGSTSIVPKSIPGVQGKNVCTSSDILSGKVKISNKKVAVIGSGMTGLETAELLGTMNNKVYVVEMMDKIGPDASWQNLTDVQGRLEKMNTSFMPSHKLVDITDESVILEEKDGEKEKLPVEYVVLSLGVRADQTLAEELNTNFHNVIKIGDTAQVGRIANAVSTAFAEAYKLN